MRKIYTIGQVASICRVSHRTAQKWFDAGILLGHRIPGGRDRRVSRESLVELMTKHGLPTDRLDGLDRSQVLLVGVNPTLVEQLTTFSGSTTNGTSENGSHRRYDLCLVADSFSLGRATALAQYHAVLIDLSIGRGEILQLAKQVRQAPGYGSVYMAALTWEDEADPAQLLSVGYSEVLPQPLDPVVLSYNLANLVRTAGIGKVVHRQRSMLSPEKKK